MESMDRPSHNIHPSPCLRDFSKANRTNIVVHFHSQSHSIPSTHPLSFSKQLCMRLGYEKHPFQSTWYTLSVYCCTFNRAFRFNCASLFVSNKLGRKQVKNSSSSFVCKLQNAKLIPEVNYKLYSMRWDCLAAARKMMWLFNAATVNITRHPFDCNNRAGV